MDIPIGVGDGIDAKQAVLATFRGQGRHPTEQPIAIDPAINNNVSNVDPERPILPRHALCDHTQAGFRDGKVRKSGLASQAGGGACKDNRAAAEGSQSLLPALLALRTTGLRGACDPLGR
jgi:hypothetical protein